MANSYFLDQPGLERLVAYINDALNNKVSKGEQVTLPEDLVYAADLADYAKKSDIPEGQDLSEYAKSADFADVVRDSDISDVVRDSDIADVVREADLADYASANDLEDLRAEVTSLYHFKGSVADMDALLAIQNPHEGDVYNLDDSGINAAWVIDDQGNGKWDEFGGPVDFTDYWAEAELQALTIPEVDAILYGGANAVVSDVAGLKAMVANDQPEVKVAMNSNMSIDNSFSVPADKKVVLDLGGNTLNVAGNNVNIIGELVIEGNGNVQANTWGLNAIGSDAKITVNGGNFTATEAALVAQRGAALEINGGTFECTDNCPIMGQGNAGNGNVNIVMNGGKLIAHITTAGYIAAGVYMPNDGSFTMNGGEIISDGAGIVMRGGQVNLNGGSISANGASGVKGKVGDSRIVVGPYAVVYDQTAHYPAVDSLELNIGKDMVLNGTDGDLSILVDDGVTANITDNRI